PVCPDSDNDGYTDAACGGTDCNDNNAAINPGASEVCGDGVDQDCSGVDLSCPPPVCPDSDNDGFADAACGGTDCNDNNAAINPGASETCGDGVDQDCSGADLSCPPPATGSHAFITSYEGPSTCIGCHQTAAYDMLDSLHMQWSGPTPDLTNTNGEDLGKAVNGINTFCTYAMSSGGACFSCHVRSDGNAPHAPDVNDVDCLMCHNDTYQRMTVTDPDTATTVVDYLGNEKTYVFGEQDADGNYSNVPNFDAMPAGTTMLQLAQNVHLPTRASCLRCHAKAGGGDWTKRGDMGLSTKSPAISEDVHMSPAGADLSCQACHATEGGHKVGGRGIDLRQTEAAAPTCQSCHGAAPHSDAVVNRHAQGQLSCQVCHIREFGKGGATEMSRDWLAPHFNPAFCNGQGGYVGHEVKVANVKPDYTWFDGTSYVYNLGETISPNADGTYTMAKANGEAFDGKSKIVPIKRHLTNTALHESGQIIAPKIMDMFMTGDFDRAVQAGMADQGLTGNYTMVEADAEMLITHGVDQKSSAPTCSECHDGSGQTPDGSKMVPFGALGYQTFPTSNICSLCHSSKSEGWEAMHNRHDGIGALDCASCHTAPPSGLTASRSSLCADCHGYKSETDPQTIHNKHVKRNIACATCHTF
ncbi:MAG: MopE-related protein, partial [Thermodesulfobacteriota bacterium]